MITVAALLVIISLIIIGSATHINNPSDDRYWYVQRQGMFALINIAIIFLLLNMDYKTLSKYAPFCIGLI